MEIHFEPEKHEFTDEFGTRIPSVSEIIRFISNEVYGDIDADILAQAAEKGTLIHKLTEELDNGKEIEIEERYAGYIQAYINWRKEHKIAFIGTEKIVYNEHSEVPYAGIIDRIGTEDGKLTIYDFKTCSSIAGKKKVLYEAQLNLYKEAYESMNFFLNVEVLKVVHLKKDGTYKELDIPINNAIANACLVLHKELSKVKRGKRK